jgi:hypothetical protein
VGLLRVGGLMRRTTGFRLAACGMGFASKRVEQIALKTQRKPIANRKIMICS